VSNDADLSFPIKFARNRIPIGVVNPPGTQTVGDLKGNVADGVGSHWWYLFHTHPATSGPGFSLPIAFGVAILIWLLQLSVWLSSKK
jgi:hypothetical protein